MKKIALLALQFAIAFTAWGITPQEAVNRFALDNTMRHASLGVMIMGIDSGNVIASYNPDLSVITASTMKTVTSTTALELLGGDYRFETVVHTIGEIDGNKLKGNLIITGYGDPTLGSQYFPKNNIIGEIIDSLRNAGITEIQGRIIVDASFYNYPAYSGWWDIGDIAEDYGAGVHGLNYRDNLVTVKFNVDPQGNINNLTLSPQVPGVEITNMMHSGSRNNWSASLDYGHSAVVLYGETNPGNHSYTIANPRPDLMLKAEVEAALKQAGIKVENRELTFESGEGDHAVLLSHYSPVSTDIITSLLDRSDNMFTHALLRAVGSRQGSYKRGEMGIDYAGADAVKQMLRDRGIDDSALFMLDGSGLARANKNSVRTFCEMLRYMAERKYGTDSLRLCDLMPSAGRRIGSVLGNNALCDSIKLKSGSMSDVQCFVGYYPADKPQVVWAILANNYSCERSTLKDNMSRMLIDALPASKQN